jgi:hypothetical protein
MNAETYDTQRDHDGAQRDEDAAPQRAWKRVLALWVAYGALIPTVGYLWLAGAALWSTAESGDFHQLNFGDFATFGVLLGIGAVGVALVGGPIALVWRWKAIPIPLWTRVVPLVLASAWVLVVTVQLLG